MTTPQTMIQIINGFYRNNLDFLHLTDYTLVRNEDGFVFLCSNGLSTSERVDLTRSFGEWGGKVFNENEPTDLLVKAILKGYGINPDKYRIDEIVQACFDSDGNRCVSMKQFWISVVRSIKR